MHCVFSGFSEAETTWGFLAGDLLGQDGPRKGGIKVAGQSRERLNKDVACTPREIWLWVGTLGNQCTTLRKGIWPFISHVSHYWLASFGGLG